MRRARITLEDSTLSAIVKVSEGNPGATYVCAELYKQGETIDPNAAMGGMAPILALDTHGIYGSRIWMLYKDVCGSNLALTVAMLRAVQLGFLSESILNHAIDNYGEGLDVAEMYKMVKERLPKFVDFRL